jgi:formylglycine-generating enzyme required for sulfatase activity
VNAAADGWNKAVEKTNRNPRGKSKVLPMTRLIWPALAAILASSFATCAQQTNLPKKGSPKQFTNSIGMRFVWIPPGSFLMGSPKEEKDRNANETQHKVTLTKGFYMGVYTVTKEQWKAVMGNTPGPDKGKKNVTVHSPGSNAGAGRPRR